MVKQSSERSDFMMIKRIAMPALVLAAMVGSPMIGGCDRTVYEERTVKERSDGTVETKEKTKTESPDGTTETKTERREIDR
jgi:hypothetical protein